MNNIATHHGVSVCHVTVGFERDTFLSPTLKALTCHANLVGQPVEQLACALQVRLTRHDALWW